MDNIKHTNASCTSLSTASEPVQIFQACSCLLACACACVFEWHARPWRLQPVLPGLYADLKALHVGGQDNDNDISLKGIA